MKGSYPSGDGGLGCGSVIQEIFADGGIGRVFRVRPGATEVRMTLTSADPTGPNGTTEIHGTTLGNLVETLPDGGVAGAVSFQGAF